MYDLVIRGGTVVDPSQGIHRRADVAVSGGLVEGGELRVDGEVVPAP